VGGLVIREGEEDVEVCLSENAIVTGIIVTETGSINDIFEYLSFYRQTTVTPDQLGEWLGFGCIRMPYP
jgi:hypothetical protein